MKLATIWGGFVGFAVAFAAGLFAGREPLMLLLDACFASAVGGWFFQWWHRMFLRSVRAAVSVQQANLPREETPTGSEGKHTRRT